MVRLRTAGRWLAVCVGLAVVGSGPGPRADGAQAPPPMEHYRLVPGFLPEHYNDEGMGLGTGFATPNPWGAYTAYLLATNARGQRTWRIENYLPNTNAGTAQGSSMYLFEGNTLALLVDTAQNTADEPGRNDLKTVVRHLLGRENDGTTPRRNPVDFVVANTHSHGDHTGKNSTMTDRVLYYPELDWPANGAPPNYRPIKEGGGPSPRGTGQAAAGIELGDRTITAIDLNQHTRGSTGYFDRENRMIATGDAIGSAYVWAHFGTMTQYARVVRHLQSVLQPFDHVDVLPAHFYQIKQGARGRPPISGRPLDKRYVDDQVRVAEAILAGTVVAEPYRAVGRNAVIATIDSAQVVHSHGNMWPADAPPEARYPGVWRAVTIPGPLPLSAAGDRFSGLRNITSRLYLIRGDGADTVYLITGASRALLIGTGAGSSGLAAFTRRLAGTMPIDVVVTSDDAGQVGGLAQFATSVLYLPEGVTAPAGATQVRRLGLGSRIDIGADAAGSPMVFEVHPLRGHSAAGITLLHVDNRLLFSGDALGTQGPDAGLILREPLAGFSTALATWRAATNGRYDVIYTARNYQWFTAPAYVDQLQEAVTKGLTGGESAWIDSAQRSGAKIVRSGGAADVVASILLESR